MCTLAVYLRAFTRHPLVIAANRDEFYARETFAPGLIAGDPPVFCGRDGVHGGTWLGVNAAGVAAALLNRRSAEPPDPRLRSRGLLCSDALAHSTAREAIGAIEDLVLTAYNPFNLLVADASEAWVVSQVASKVSCTPLEPGLHLLTNLAVDDPECPRIASSTRRFAELATVSNGDPDADDLVARLRLLLSRHDLQLDPRDPTTSNALCVHLETFGTRSSTILLLDRDGRWDYRHCPSAPCRGAHRAVPAAEEFDRQRRRA